MDVTSSGFCAVLSVGHAHRRNVAVPVAQHLAAVGGLPVTVFGHRGNERHDDIVSAVASRDGALLVVDALGGGPAAEQLFDREVESILATAHLPVLVFGPRAGAVSVPSTLLVAADGSDTPDAVVLTVVAWTTTFPPSSAVVVALDSPDPWPPDATDPVVDAPRHLAATLATAGVAVDVQRRSTFDPVSGLLEAARDVTGAVLVVCAPHHPTSASHWFSTSRRLIRHAPAPVLVVPGGIGSPSAS